MDIESELEIGKDKFMRENYPAAIEHFTLVLNELDADEYPVDYAAICNLLGISFYYNHNPEKAIEYFERALELMSDENDEHVEQVRQNLTAAKEYIEDLEKNIKEFRKAIKMESDDEQMGIITSQLGAFLFLRGEMDEAEELFLKSLNLFEKTDNLVAMAAVYNNLSMFYDDVRSLDMLYKAMDILENEGHMNGMIDTYESLYRYYWRNGNDEEALHFILKKIELVEELFKNSDEENIQNYIETFRTAADLALLLGKADLAMELTEKLTKYLDDKNPVEENL